MVDEYVTEEPGMVGDFIRDPRSKTLNPLTKFAGHTFAAIIDYAKERDLSKMTLEDLFEYLQPIDKEASNYGES
jgi:hypothetical protein